MRRVFVGVAGVDSGGREDRSMDIGLRDLLEVGREEGEEEGGDASVEDILDTVALRSYGWAVV
jgi:hypothetical protein